MPWTGYSINPMTIDVPMMKRLFFIFLLFCSWIYPVLAVDSSEMQRIYDEVKTPFKYGMVVAPADNYHKIDCPTVYREQGKWYMTYVVYDGKDGLDGRGYETWLAESDDLLQWRTLGRILSFRDGCWDSNQRGGFPALIDWTWGGSYRMQKYKGRHWMTYIGGEGTGYEAVRAPLFVGQAWTKGDITKAHEWQSLARPLLSIHDKDAQWWEKLVQYKSTVYWDEARTLGSRFVMYYNAGGINPANGMKAERIGIATSDDMKRWARYAGNPVYSHEAPGIITGDAQIVKMGDKYVMFYFSAYNPARRYNAYNTFSVSTDLIHWNDWDGPDLIAPSKDYDDMFAHKSYVLKHEGVVYHFYCAVNRAGQRGIAVATSVPMGRSEVSFPAPEKTGKRTVVDLAADWTARLVAVSDTAGAVEGKEQKVRLPHNWDDYYGYRQLKHGNLHGSAVYSRELDCRIEQGRRYFLQFEGVGTYATVTVNGHCFGREPVGRTVYTLDVTDVLVQGKNRLEVLVDHPSMITDMPWVCGGCSSEWGFSEGSQPFGIFRPVSLIATSDVRIEPFGVHVWNNEQCDSVFIETEVKNYGAAACDVTVVNKFAKASGKSVFRLEETVRLQLGETRLVRQSSPVDAPQRWSLDDPYLYQLTSMLKDTGNKTIDDVVTPFGIRSVSWPVMRAHGVPGMAAADAPTFRLNGKNVFINGTCEYEHMFGQGHAFSAEQIKSRVKQIRNAGFNAFREAHQPHNLLYQQLFDEQGMLFWSQFSAHIWYDTPAFRDNFKKLLRRWIRERRNSPSVVMWGLQNESTLPKDFAEECCAIIREMDPTARTMRPVTTCNGGEGTDWNVIQNWSGTYGGSADNYAAELRRPDQLLNGEYGAWRTIDLHGSNGYSEEAFVQLLSTKARLADSVADSVCGHFQWIFSSHDNPGRVQPDGAYRRVDKVGPVNYKGLTTIWEEPTEAYYMYKSRYGKPEGDTLAVTAADRNVDLLKAAAGYTYVYRINCGGDGYTDSYGQLWEQDTDRYSHSWGADFGLNPYQASQRTVSAAIRGTDDDKLFQSFRFGRHRLYYDFPADTALRYRIELYFAEPWHGREARVHTDCEGMRIFDVAVNDSVVVDDLDIWAESGYAGAMRKVVYATARQGRLRISFPEVKAGQAVISAIAIACEGSAPAGKVGASYPVAPFTWAAMDTDTVAKLPKSELPVDTEARPSVAYQPVVSGATAAWDIQPGLGQEYALRFHYRNAAQASVRGELTLTDAKGAVLIRRPVTFLPTKHKFKMLSTATGTQINAGHYRVTVEGAKGVEFKTLEIQ